MELNALDRKKLWGLAAAKCSKCKSDLFLKKESHTNVGEECHISSHRPNHPSESFSRYDPSLTEDERDKRYDNAILLCATCHKIIDNPESIEYTIEKLHQIKAEHEAWVVENLEENTEESRELKRRIEEINRQIKIYKTEFKLNKSRYDWFEGKISEIIEEKGLEEEFTPVLTSSTTKYLEESLEEYGGETDRPVSCPFCGANLVHVPGSDMMYCRGCKKYIEEV